MYLCKYAVETSIRLNIVTCLFFVSLTRVCLCLCVCNDWTSPLPRCVMLFVSNLGTPHSSPFHFCCESASVPRGVMVLVSILALPNRGCFIFAAKVPPLYPVV